ncbi:Phosphorylated carbohydrates phosphatase [compost metagenome]
MNPSQLFQAVLFDMDGVVVDNAALHREVWADFARSHGLAPTEAEIRATDGRRAVDVVRLLFKEELEDDQVLARAAEREIRYRQSLERGHVQAVPGIEPFLEALGEARIPRVLATSATLENVDLVLRRLALANLFDAVISAEDVRNGKPNPEVYLTAASRAHADPARCLVIEDALPGVQAAKAAGATCLGLSTSQSEEALYGAGADWVAPHFLALPEPLRARLSLLGPEG